MYDSCIATLEEISGGLDRGKALETNGFLLQIRNFQFLVFVIIFDRILTYSKCLSDCLQGSQTNLAKAGDLVSGTLATLEMFRTDEEWNKIFSYAEEVAKVTSISTLPRQSRQRQY